MKFDFKKNKRLLIGIPLVCLLLITSFKLLPSESKFYLKTDIIDLRNSLLPVSIIMSILISFLLVFRKSEYNGGIMSKGIYIVYIIGMSYIIHNMTSDCLTTIVLKTNRFTAKKSINETFVISTISTTNGNGEADSKLWVVMHDDIYEVRGRIANKPYEGDVDGIFMIYDDYMKITDKDKFAITLQEGLFGIPYNPKVVD